MANNKQTNNSDLAAMALAEQANKLGLRDFLTDIGTPAITKTEIELNKFITGDKTLLEVKRIIKKVAPFPVPVLLIGETGTGKELLARALHGERAGKFVAVNCGGIPDTLLETEFFGSYSGAFTGAINREGYIAEAARGTLFLDEVGELPPLLQVKLLRVLQEKLYRRVGSTREEPMLCRIVAATNRLDLTNPKEFRQDLYYRLAVCALRIPPLRERLPDVDLIVASNIVFDSSVEGMLKRFNKEVLLADITSSDGSVWPGNVRQLLNRIEAFKILNGLE
jgi:transcriptional regulator with PAS, ATPase and Fis domain